MSEQNPLFRKAALDKLASPERLDVLMQVTSPKGWAALMMMGVILSSAVVWGFVGNVPSKVDAQGILIPSGGLRQLTSTGEGMVTRLHVGKDSKIQEGSMIAELNLPDIEDRIRQAEQRYQDALREAQNASAEDSATNAGTYATINQYESEKRRLQIEIGAKRDELAQKQEQLQKGIITASRVEAIRRELSMMQERMIGLDAQIRSAQAGARGINQRSRGRFAQADQAKAELDRLKNQQQRVTQVTSTQTGVIVELRKNVGDPVRNGELLAIVEPLGTTVEPVVYVDSAQGKLIRPGMPVQVMPAGIERERYGFIKGEVVSITDYAATPESIAQLVANQAVASELLGGKSRLEMRVKLLPNPNTVSGFQWSTLEGAPQRISSGTRLSVSVEVERRRPVTFVLPKIKEMLGLS
jgi:HlyD family secretion protein